MLLRNRERLSRSKFGLAIFAILSLVFVGAGLIIYRTFAADINPENIPQHVIDSVNDGTVCPVRPNPDPIEGDENCSKATVYEKTDFYKKYNDLGAIGSFHLIGLESISNIYTGGIHGNVATKSLTSIPYLGIPDFPEINYIKDDLTTVPGFFQNSADSIVVLGNNISIRPSVNPYNTAVYISSPSNNEPHDQGTWGIDYGTRHDNGSWDETFWQDYTAEFLDMDQLRNEAIQYNQETRAKYINPDPDDELIADTESSCARNTQYGTDITCTISDPTKVSYFNFDASDNLWNNGQIGSLTINDAAPQKTFLINIDMAGVTPNGDGKKVFNFNGNVTVNLTDGTSINNSNFANYTETAETNIVYNFYDSSNSDGLFDGIITGNSIYGMIVAPEAAVQNVYGGIRGTVIAKNINSISNTYQSNFYGRLVVFPTVTVRHTNPDGSQFMFPGVDTSDQVFTVSDMTYTTSPLDLGEDVSYTITLAEDSAPASGEMPDEDIVVIYVYAKDTYHLTIHHVDENGNTLFEDTGGDYDFNTPYTAEPVSNADIAAGYYDIALAEGSASSSGTIRGDTVVTYQYTRKKATLQVYHKNTNGEDLVTVDPDLILYGNPYSASPDANLLDEYDVSPSETVSGIVSDATVDDPEAENKTLTITFIYTRKQFDVTVIHIVDGSEVSNTTTHNVDYGTAITTNAYLDAYPAAGYTRSVSVSPDGATTVTQNTTITYMYTIKQFTLTVKHIVDGEENTSLGTQTNVNYNSDIPTNGCHSDYAASHTCEVTVNPEGATKVTQNTTVTYTYTIKQFDLTVVHIVDGETVSSTTTQENYGTTIATDAYLDAYPAAAYTRSVSVNPDGATTVTQNTTVTYTYVIKQFKLTIKHVVNGVEDMNHHSETNVNYGTPVSTDAYLDDYPAAAYTRSVSVSPDGATTVTQATTITYTYTIKQFKLTVKHVVNGAEDMDHHTENDVNYGTAISTNAYLDDYPEEAYIRSVTVSPDGATTVTQNTTVTYNYIIRQFKLTVRHIVDGVENMDHHSETDVNYGTTITTNNYLEDYPATAYTRSVSVNPDGATTVTQNTTITYTYAIKQFKLTIKHMVDGVEDMNHHSETNENYGTPITTNAYLDAYPAAAYIRSVTVDPDGATTITQNTTITYTYAIKKYDVTVVHIVDGTEVSSDTTHNVNYGTPIVTDAYLDAYPAAAYERSVSVDPENATQVTANTTITYTYTIRKYNVTVIHIVDGVEQARSTTADVEYGTPIVTDAYLDAYPETAYTRSVSVNPDGATTVTQNTTITYTYTIRQFTLTVKHVIDGVEDMNHHTETNVNHGTGIDTNGCLSSYAASHTCAVTVSPDGAITVTQNTTITYNYTIKQFKLTVRHIINGTEDMDAHSETDVNYGTPVATDAYLDAYPAANYIRSVSVNPANATTVTEVTTVTYTYTSKTAIFQVFHKYANGTTFDSSEPEEIAYGNPYSASPIADMLVEYDVSPAETVSGTVSDATVDDPNATTKTITVVFTYTKKKFSLTITHIVDGETVSNVTTQEEYGTAITTDAYLDAYPETTYTRSVTVSPNGATTVTQATTITYTYTIKNFLITNIHIVDGEEVSRSVTNNAHYGDTVPTDQYLPGFPASDYNRSVTVEPTGPTVTENTTVTYRYNIKTASFQVFHKDSDGEDLVTVDPQTINYGYPYSASPVASLLEEYDVSPTETISGIVSDATVDDPTATSKTITVTFTYTRKTAKVIARHVDANGNTLKADVVQNNQPWSSTYTTVPHAELTTNYTYVTDKSESGIISSETVNANREVIVTYTYTRKTASLVVIHQFVTGDTSLTHTDTSVVNYGDPYSASPIAEYLTAYNVSPTTTVSGTVSDTTVDDASAADKTITITFTYTIKTYTLTVLHENPDGTKFENGTHDTTATNREHGSPYETHRVENQNYDAALKIDSDSASGTMDSNKTVTYVYTRKVATITAKHQDTNGNTLKADVTQQVDWGETYTTVPHPELTTAYNYTVEGSESDIVAGDVTVIYKYTKKQFNLTVHHVNADGSEFSPDVITPYDYGTPYTAEPIANDDYNYTVISGEINGTITGHTSVTFEYTKKIGTFKVIHQDVNGNLLAPTESTPLEYGSHYEAHPSSTLTEAYNYTVSGGSVDGFIHGDVTIIYTYTKKAYVLTVHHVLENGSMYKPDVITDYDHGDHYDALPNTEDINYEYRVKDNASTSGTITSNLEITFIYKKKTATFTVKHHSSTGSELAPDDITTIDWGETYTAHPSPDLIEEYDYAADISEHGLVQGDVTVIYTYTRKQFTLTVHHRLENGSEYKPDFTDTYEYGATYTAVPDTSDINYEYTLAAGDSASDIIKSNTEVTFIYKKKVATFTTIHMVNGTEHSRTEVPIEWGETYTAHPSSALTTEYDYTADKSEHGVVSGDVTVTYTYTRKKFNVTVHHIYADGSEFAPDDTTVVEYGGSYTAVAKNDPSYNPVVTEGALVNENITNHLTITIKYILKQGHITVHHVDENGGTLAPDEEYDIDYGSTYSVAPKADLLVANDVSADVSESDTVSGDVVITYTYSRKHYTLVTHHILENGSMYKPDVSTPYRHGDPYEAKPDTSNNSYEYRVKDNASTSGTITSNLEVTFIYKKKTAILRVEHLDKDGNPLIEAEETTLEYDEPYTTHPASSLAVGYDYTVVGSESDTIHGDVVVKYIYTKKKYIVIVHHVDKDGEELGEDEEIEVEFGDTFVPRGLAELINKYDFEVDPETPIPQTITGPLEIRLIYTEKPEVPQTYDGIIAIVATILAVATFTGAGLFTIKRRHA